MPIGIFRFLFSYFCLGTDAEQIPYWARPRYLQEENVLDFNLRPLFDLTSHTSTYVPSLIDLYKKSCPLYAHKGIFSARVTVLP